VEDWTPEPSPPSTPEEPSLNLDSVDFEAAIPELAEPENLTETSVEPPSSEQIGKRNDSGKGNRKPTDSTVAGEQNRSRGSWSFRKTEENIRTLWKNREASCLLMWKGECLICSCNPRSRNQRKKWVTDKFGKADFDCYDPEEKTTAEISQCLAGKIYEPKKKAPPQ
jgi:hypothetical protein